ncbi:hypothetical protein [Candidatus Ruminimicrobium bovinum]|uniref:hypothetical protein n=1 Tax=Candidatus Ruminimicrobium bovinum TaxID=3242779 RepID=UPI0039B9BE00
MAKQKRENNSFLSTIYLILLFLVGIVVGLTFQSSDSVNKKQIKVKTNTESRQVKSAQQKQQSVKNEQKQSFSEKDKDNQTKQTVKQEQPKTDKKADNPVVQKLENELVTVLVSNGIIQQDIIVQYAKEIQDKKNTYTQYYKEIRVPKNKRIDTFEYQFKTLARNCKIEVSKVIDDNLGIITYSFYEKDKIYSIVVLKKSDNK